MKPAMLRPPVSDDFRRVTEGTPLWSNPKITWTAIVVLALFVAVYVVYPVGSSMWNTLVKTPELVIDQFEHVVEVREADGTSFKRETDPHFDERVKRIKAGVYDVTRTGRKGS